MKLLELIYVLIAIESGGDTTAIGDNGKAYGCLQIHATMVQDFNRITGKRYTHRDAFCRAKSIEMATAVLSHYKRHKERTNVQPAHTEHLARIWNGGGSAWKKQKGIKEHRLQIYYNKVWVEIKKRNNDNYKRTNRRS